MKVKRLSTKCGPLDELLGGGIEFKTLTNVYGPPGCGKTTLCLQTSVSCVEGGKQVIFIDTEGGFSKERLGQIAKDSKQVMDEIIFIEPEDFNDQEDSVSRLGNICKKKDVGLVVLDSLVTLYRLELEEDRIKKVNRRLARQLSNLSNISRDYEVPVLITNQVYSDIENGGVELVSRDVAKYQSKCLLELKKFDKGKRLAILRKHRSRPEGEEAPLVISERGFEKPDGTFDFL